MERASPFHASTDGCGVGVPLERANPLNADTCTRNVGMSNPMDAADADEHDIDETAAAS